MIIVTFFKHEAMWSNQNQVKNILQLFWKTEPVSVAIGSDEFWLGVKG